MATEHEDGGPAPDSEITLPVSRTFPADDAFYAESEAWIEEVRGKVRAPGPLGVETEHLAGTDEIVMTLSQTDLVKDLPWGPDVVEG